MLPIEERLHHPLAPRGGLVWERATLAQRVAMLVRSGGTDDRKEAMSGISPFAVSGPSTIGAGSASDIAWLVPQAVESRHLVVMRPGREAVQRAATMIDVGTVLMAWRAAERELNEIHEGSPEWSRVNAEIVSLRAAYHRLFEERSQLAASY